MTDILRLPGWEPTSIDETDDLMTVHAVYLSSPDVCHVCGVINAPLYKHGQREITFLDTPIGKPTRILAKVQRYRCRECGGLFYPPLEGIDAERRMTLRCVAYISKQCLIDTFQRVSEHLGCDEKTIRNVAYRAKIRAEVLSAYGGKCECCGESHPEFLALDHINGGGGKERRTVAGNTSVGVYRLARNAGYPKDKYRLLCHNCNCAIGWYGYCPHQKENSCG